MLDVLLLSVLLGAAPPAEPPALFAGLPPGPFAVGCIVKPLRDAARGGPAGPRHVQATVWYPAAAAAGEPLRYRDYVAMAATESDPAAGTPAHRAEVLDGYRAFLAANGLGTEAVATWLDAPMLARRDAPPVAGARPLVLLAGGSGGGAEDQAVLGEWLASHGYVVATTPSPARTGTRLRSDADVLPMARAQAEDLRLARRALAGFPPVDRGAPVGLVGYSFGARTALLLARDEGTGAMVSLDGGIANRAGREWLKGSGVDPAAVDLPVLHVFQDSEDEVVPDFSLLASMKKSDRLLVRVAGMRHAELITYGAALAGLPGLAPADEAPRVAERRRAAHAYARAWLDAELRGDAAAASFLAGPGEGFPAGLLRIIRMSAPVPARRPAR